MGRFVLINFCFWFSSGDDVRKVLKVSVRCVWSSSMMALILDFVYVY